jgi:HAD superfamily hydrolase (TIGR01549 family)
VKQIFLKRRTPLTRQHIPLTERNIRCILFDFGDTLWTRNPATFEQIEHQASLNGARVVREYIDAQRFPLINTGPFGAILQQQIHRETRLRMRKRVGYEPDFADSTLSALEQLELPRLDHAAGAAIYEALRVRIPESRIVFPETVETLTALQARGYILGVVTNRGYGGPPFVEDMKQIGFDRFFDLSAMAVSADLGIRKPNPDMFLYVLNKLGVSAHEAAMVGDSLHADVQGANFLNIFSIWRPKKRIRQDALASTAQQTTLEHLPEGATQLQENDDDQFLNKADLLRYAQQHRKHEHIIPGADAEPDYIIYTLSDLLELF